MTSQVTLSALWTLGVVGRLFSRSCVSYSDQFSCMQLIGLSSEIKLILDLSHIIFSHYLIGESINIIAKDHLYSYLTVPHQEIVVLNFSDPHL